MVRKTIKRWLYGSCPGLKGAFPYFGVKVFFPPRSLAFQAACDQGIYECDNTAIICSLIQPNSTYFDVGANIGLMAIPALHRCSSCSVISMEPSPHTYPYLMRTAEQSGFGRRWIILNKGAANCVGRMDFFAGKAENGLFDGLRDTGRAGPKARVEVPVSTIDAEWQALGNPKVSVIKLDIEGAELEALKGAHQCLARERPFVIMEWNASNLISFKCLPEELLVFASNAGYEVLGLPHGVPIKNSKNLQIQMTRTESFLLSPLP